MVHTPLYVFMTCTGDIVASSTMTDTELELRRFCAVLSGEMRKLKLNNEHI